MKPRRKFLTARWCNLILANYPVPEELLRPLLPPGCELDRRDGKCWASLVGFQFLNTRVLGIGWPGFRNFPEWNLRFYVKGPAEPTTGSVSPEAPPNHDAEGRRGVCFVREFVPSWLIATTARVLYNEPYRSARMTMTVTPSTTSVAAEYTVRWGGRVHSLRATGAGPAFRPVEESAMHWFKEHSWGFGTSRKGKLIRYRVDHPTWDVYPVREHTVDVDWAAMYGAEWGEMQKVEPASVILAAGSDVSVYPKS